MAQRIQRAALEKRIIRALEALEEHMKSFELLEERLARAIEERVYEVRVLAYIILILCAILVATTLGTLVKMLLS